MKSLPAIVALAALVAIPLRAQSFVDVAVPSGLALPATPNMALGTGACVGDFDGDGDLDLVLPAGLGQPLRLYLNDGTGAFVDATASSGLDVADLVTSLVPGDVDNDGDLDLFVARLYVPNQLYVNDGSASFVDEASVRGVDHSGAAFAASFGDYDRDGWLDLYVGNNSLQPNVLFRNVGSGTFSDVTSSTGVGDAGEALAVAFVDYDEDGWPDIFVGNDKGWNVHPNRMFRNDGNGGFTDVSGQINAGQGIESMGVEFADLFNDGGVDIFVSDTLPDHLLLIWNGTSFVAQQAVYGMTATSSDGWACRFMDYDNDGWVDLHVVQNIHPNHLYRNPGAAAAAAISWPEIGPALGLDRSVEQYAAAVGDLDEDGRLDILEVIPSSFTGVNGVALMRNQASAGNWIRVRTEGTSSNRSGIGARIQVTAGGLTQTRHVRSGVGYLAASDLRCHFGLGNASQADTIEINWPSGQVQVMRNVPANQTIHAQEPCLELLGPAIIGTSPTLELSVPGDGGLLAITVLTLGTSPGILLASGRTIPVNLDALASLTLTPQNPILPQGSGVLRATGLRAGPLVIPYFPPLVGLAVHAGGVTVEAGAPDGVRNILMPLEIILQ